MSDMIRKSDALAAVNAVFNGYPNHASDAIAALPAVTVGVRYVFADGETIDEMRYKFLASKDGKDLYAQGDVKLAWVNEGDLYNAQFALEPVAAPDPAAMPQAKRCAACGSTVTDLDDHLVHDEECGGEPDEPVAAPDDHVPLHPSDLFQNPDTTDMGEPVAAPVFGRATFCDTNSPAPDPAAIREAALHEAADHFSSLAVLRKMWSAAEIENAILTLIPTKGAAE